MNAAGSGGSGRPSGSLRHPPPATAEAGAAVLVAGQRRGRPSYSPPGRGGSILVKTVSGVRK